MIYVVSFECEASVKVGGPPGRTSSQPAGLVVVCPCALWSQFMKVPELDADLGRGPNTQHYRFKEPRYTSFDWFNLELEEHSSSRTNKVEIEK